MMETLLKLSPPTMAIVGFLVLRTYLQSKYPSPSALGRVLPKLCVVDSDEMLHYKEVSEEEWKSKPHARPALLRNQVRIHWFYFGQMKANIFRFQQVVRFETLKIDSDLNRNTHRRVPWAGCFRNCVSWTLMRCSTIKKYRKRSGSQSRMRGPRCSGTRFGFIGFILAR